jgi:hypothetical protein
MTSSHHRKDELTSFLRKSAHGRICTRTRPHLKRLSLLLYYMGFEAGRIPRCCPGPFLVPNQVSTLALSYPKKWTCAPDSHRIMWTCKLRARLFALRTLKGWFPQPDSHQHRLVHNEECCCYTMQGVFEKECGMSVLPRLVEFGYACAIAQTHGVRSSDCIGAVRQHGHVHCYINAAKKVAGVGSAPTSADLQSAAHLSEPSSVWIEWSLRVVTLHGLPVICRRLCC